MTIEKLFRLKNITYTDVEAILKHFDIIEK